jgi:hypothetical protein
MPYIHQQHNFERRVRRRVSSASNSRRERPTATAVATAALLLLLLLLLLDSLTGVGNISRPFRPAMSHPIALRHRARACRYPPTLLQVSSRWSRACLGKTTVCLKNGHVKKDISSSIAPQVRLACVYSNTWQSNNHWSCLRLSQACLGKRGSS